MFGDIFACLLVTFRLFLVLVLAVNVVAWLLFADDDDEDLAVQRNPDGPLSSGCCSPACIFARPPVITRRPVPLDRQNDGSASAAGVEPLLFDVVEKLATSVDDDERLSAAASETDSIDGAQNTRDQQPTIAPASNAVHDFDTGEAAMTDEQRMIAYGRENVEVLNTLVNVDSYQPVTSAAMEQRGRGADVDDEGILLDNDERATTAESDAIQPSQGVAVFAASTETPKSTVQAPQPIARRPASHW